MDPLWLIVEGPDGAGKSWFAKEAAHVLASHGGSKPERPCVLQKLSYNSQKVEYVTEPVQIMQMLRCHVVQDRGVLSGPVYEPIMRGDQKRQGWLEPLVERAVRAGAVVLYVDADSHVLEDRLAERGDDYVSVDNLLDIQAGYKRWTERWADLGGRITRFDTTHEFPDRLGLELVLSALATKGH